jgi:nitrate reductase molybdenum cofactor assembly chaperone NarJ/NarW
MKTCKLLGALLSYPSAALIEALPELAAEIDRERLLAPATRASLGQLLDELAFTDLMTLEERYVDLFDRVRSLSLHLFEHVHGESRERGQALIDLSALYERHGFQLKGDELPDYLPAFLEFLGALPETEARELLGETGRILQGLGARLGKRGSRYAAVFEALLAIAGSPGIAQETVSDEEIKIEDDPVTLDRQWAEEPAFGPAPGGCGVKSAPAAAVVHIHARKAA